MLELNFHWVPIRKSTDTGSKKKLCSKISTKFINIQHFPKYGFLMDGPVPIYSVDNGRLRLKKGSKPWHFSVSSQNQDFVGEGLYVLYSTP